ncbi:hypothetical protein Tco_1350594 [Tanacetum coccineum]
MPSVRTHHSPNTCTPKPRSNNQTSMNWPASKSSEETLKAVQKADHSRNPSDISKTKASADNTSGPTPQRKERCTLQCALSSCFRPLSSTFFIFLHDHPVIKWIKVH